MKASLTKSKSIEFNLKRLSSIESGRVWSKAFEFNWKRLSLIESVRVWEFDWKRSSLIKSIRLNAFDQYCMSSQLAISSTVEMRASKIHQSAQCMEAMDFDKNHWYLDQLKAEGLQFRIKCRNWLFTQAASEHFGLYISETTVPTNLIC